MKRYGLLSGSALRYVATVVIVISASVASANECWSFKSFDDDDRIFDEITEIQLNIEPQKSSEAVRLAQLRIFETVKGKNKPVMSEGHVKCRKLDDSKAWECTAVERGQFLLENSDKGIKLTISEYLNTVQKVAGQELGFEFEVDQGDPPIELFTNVKCPKK